MLFGIPDAIAMIGMANFPLISSGVFSECKLHWFYKGLVFSFFLDPWNHSEMANLHWLYKVLERRVTLHDSIFTFPTCLIGVWLLFVGPGSINKIRMAHFPLGL